MLISRKLDKKLDKKDAVKWQRLFLSDFASEPKF